MNDFSLTGLWFSPATNMEHDQGFINTFKKV